MDSSNLRNALGNKGYERTRVYSEDEILAEIEKASKQEPRNIPSQPQSASATAQSPTIPLLSGEYSLLSGDFGKQIHEEIVERFKQIPVVYNNVNFSTQDNIVKGSNPFYVVAVNQILRNNGLKIRTANQADLEKIVKTNVLNLRGQYEESALVLRNKENPNQYLANNLTEQFKKFGMFASPNAPLVIPLHASYLEQDSNSPYNASFIILDKSKIFPAPILSSTNGSYINPNEMDANGLPSKVYDSQINGNRQLWTRNSGLSRLCLYWDLGINSGIDDLAGSYENGRVVLVSAEGTTAKNLGGKS